MTYEAAMLGALVAVCALAAFGIVLIVHRTTKADRSPGDIWLASGGFTAIVAAADPVGHIITTSTGHPLNFGAMWRAPEIEFTQTHHYGYMDSVEDIATTLTGYHHSAVEVFDSVFIPPMGPELLCTATSQSIGADTMNFAYTPMPFDVAAEVRNAGWAPTDTVWGEIELPTSSQLRIANSDPARRLLSPAINNTSSIFEKAGLAAMISSQRCNAAT